MRLHVQARPSRPRPVGRDPHRGRTRHLVGPLLYGTEGEGPATPVYHLLDPKVNRASAYSKVIIR